MAHPYGNARNQDSNAGTRWTNGGIEAWAHGIIWNQSAQSTRIRNHIWNQESHMESGITVESFTDGPCCQRLLLESGTTKSSAPKYQKGTCTTHLAAANSCAAFLFRDQWTSESHMTHSPPGTDATPVGHWHLPSYPNGLHRQLLSVPQRRDKPPPATLLPSRLSSAPEEQFTQAVHCTGGLLHLVPRADHLALWESKFNPARKEARH